MRPLEQAQCDWAGVHIRRRNLYAKKKIHQQWVYPEKRPCEGSMAIWEPRKEAAQETKHVDTLILDFQSSKLQKN